MTSHEKLLEETLMGLSKMQLPLSRDLSEKEVKEIQRRENAEFKINSLTIQQKKEIGEFRLGIIHNVIEDHPEADPWEVFEMMIENGF